MSATADNQTISGDVERGNALLERIISLAPVTDEQQRFMYRTETMTPQDARDFITALAVHGMFVVATKEADLLTALRGAHSLLSLVAYTGDCEGLYSEMALRDMATITALLAATDGATEGEGQ